MNHKSSMPPSNKEPHGAWDGAEDYDVRATGRLSTLSFERSEAAQKIDANRRNSRWLIGGYLVAAVVWILTTDLAVELWVSEAMQARAQTIKGIVFVVLSASFLAYLVARHFRRLERVEQEVQHRDTHIGRIIDTMANGVALIDLDGTIVDANPALAEILGQSRDELIGSSLKAVRTAGNEEMTPPSVILDSARTNGQWSGELERPRDGGDDIPVHLTLAPLYDDDGRLTGYVGDYLDLREVKTVRARLEGLGAVIEQLATATELEDVGETAVQAAVDLSGAAAGSVLLRADSGQFENRWACGFSDDRQLEPADAPLVEEVVRTGQPRTIDQIADDTTPVDAYTCEDFRRVIAVPIEVDNDARGALVVGTADESAPLDERQFPLLESIARQIGVAIHRHELLEDARRSEARFRGVVNTVPDILYTASLPELDTEFISPSVQRVIGVSPDQFLENPSLWRDQIHDDDIDDLDGVLDDAVDSDAEHYSVEYRRWNRDHSEFRWFQDRGRIKRNDEGEPIAITGVVSDVTTRKEAQQRLSFLAFNDRLTGLPNRLGLLERLREDLDNGASSRGLLLYCDIDNFHLVNDIHGHQTGNDLIVETADRLESIFPGGAILARIGADEFVAYLGADDVEGDQTTDDALEDRAREYATDVMTAFRQPFSLRDQPSYLSISIGIGLMTSHVENPRELLKNAHRALSHAKELGPSNFAFYAGELADRQQRRLSLQSKLHRAIEEQELDLHYQPVVDLDTGDIVGAEALARWTTADGESISPGEFIPVAEESGLIIPLGDWVIERVCRDLRNWLDAGLDLRVSLNLSPRQFFHLDIVDRVEATVREGGLSPDRIELELTESDMLADPEESTQILQRLRDVGFTIAIDDFGTGYSSLQRLKQLPVQTLKIDRSFICELPAASRDASIVDSIVTLSENFGMDALAEGIETLPQWKFLCDRGCRQGQGYYFSRPVPAEKFRKLVAEATPPWRDAVSEITG